MIEIRIPRSPLDQFIEFFISYEELNPPHKIDRFLPDGNTEIIIDLKDTPQYIYDNETLKEKQSCRNVWASGVRTKYISIPSGQDSAMFIIHFKKGMAYPFFPFRMRDISDRVIDADLIWGNEFTLLREKLLEEKEIGKRFAIVESFLLKRYLQKLDINPCIAYAVEEISDKPNQTNLGKLYAKIGYSQKHFTDMFKNHVGITPKGYVKILRFQKAISEIEMNKPVRWTSIAQDSGFYDQAHFINNFRSFSGFTPEEYLRKKNGVLNYVPVE